MGLTVIWGCDRCRRRIICESALFLTWCIQLWHRSDSSPADSHLWDTEAQFGVWRVDSAGVSRPAAPQLAAPPSAAPGAASPCSAPAAPREGLRSGVKHEKYGILTKLLGSATLDKMDHYLSYVRYRSHLSLRQVFLHLLHLLLN